MYQVIGVQNNNKRIVVATPDTAGEALTHFRAAQSLFPIVLVQSPDGEDISGFELSRRFQKESEAPYA